MKVRSALAPLMAAAITGLAFLLRAYRLPDQNIWWDEGWTIWLGQRDLAWIALRTAADEHPPLHYWLMHFWELVAGNGALAARFFSLFFGVLLVALLYRIGRKIGGPSLGLLAALILALARFQVWWSQDVKNYTLSGFFALAGLWFVLQLASDRTGSAKRGTRAFKPETPPLTPPRSAGRGLEDTGDGAVAAPPPRLRTSIVPAPASGGEVQGRIGKVIGLLTRPLVGARGPQAPGFFHSPRPQVGGGGRGWGNWARGTDRTWPAYAGYVLSLTLALYSHYLAALVFLAANLFVLFLLVRDWRSGRNPLPLFWRWSLAQLAVLAMFAPWMFLYLRNAITFTAAPVFDFGTFIRLAATVFPLGLTTDIDRFALPAGGMTLLAGLGAAWIVVAPSRPAPESMEHGAPQSSPAPGTRYPPLLSSGALLALITVLIPPVLLYVLSLTPAAFFAPKIQARYLLILLPAYTLLLALGLLFIWRLPELVRSPETGERRKGYGARELARGATAVATRVARAAAVLAFLFVATVQIWTLSDYYRARVLHDDYTTLANVVNDFVQPGDVVLLNTDQEWPTFLYYLRRPADWLGVPNGARLDSNGAHRLAAQAAQYHAVWLVTIPDALEKDPEHLLEQALDRYQAPGATAPLWHKSYEQAFGDKRLALYLPFSGSRDLSRVPAGNFAPQLARDESFGEEARLLGLDLPVRKAQPGDTLRVVTFWRTMSAARAVPLLVKLATPSGMALVEQSITIPDGDLARVQADLQIPPGTPAGLLNIVVRPCCRDAVVGSIEVIARRVETGSAPLTHPLDIRLGGIRLIGYDLPQTGVHPGDTLPLTLFWNAEQPQAASYIVFVHLLGEHYNAAQDNFLWGQVDRLPRGGELPTSAWPPGTTIDDSYHVPVAPNAPPGRYQIEVGLYDAATGNRLPVSDANGNRAGDSVILSEIEIR